MFEIDLRSMKGKNCAKKIWHTLLSAVDLYKHESVLLDLLVTVSELCQYLRISTINSTPLSCN